MADMDYSFCEEIIEAVIEWMGLRWTKSMMKRELRQWFPGLSGMSCDFIFSRARKAIRERYGIDPQEYKGKQIEFYESVLRGKAKTHDKLTAAERLDKLFGLEHISGEDPDVIAQKIRDAILKADESVTGGQNESGSTDESKGQVDAKQGTAETNNDAEILKENNASCESGIRDETVGDEILPEILDNIGTLTEEDLKDFRKNKNG